MSYLVLARKYRPQSFAALIGQDVIVRTLKNAMALGRVHHAFVLAGSRGVGKTSTARLLAKSLNCQRGASVEPCDACASCQGIAAGNAPAVIEIDGASHTGVDHVRDLRETAQYRPQVGTFKIYIIDEVHMLSQAAFNALLKVLEEPPAHVKFIFATTEPHKIPATILSRCQRFDFRRVPAAALSAHLAEVARAEGVTISDDALGALARSAAGSVRDALSLLDQAIGFAGEAPVDREVLAAMGALDRSLAFDLLDAVLGRAPQRLAQGVHEVDVQGHDWAEVARLFLLHLRDVALCRALMDDAEAFSQAVDATPDEAERLREQAQQRGAEDWQRAFEKMASVVEAVARSSAPKATLEMGLLRLMQIAPAADVAALLGRIDGYMAALPSAAGEAMPAAPPASKPTALAAGPALSADGEMGSAASPADARWRQFVGQVRQQRPSLASLLEHAQLVTLRPGEAKVACLPGSFCLDALQDPDNRRLLEEVLSRFDGRPARFAVEPMAAGQPPSPSLAEQRAQEAERAWQQTERAARAHPGVQMAVQALGTSIRHVGPTAASGA